jgi:hypothetical protein
MNLVIVVKIRQGVKILLIGNLNFVYIYYFTLFLFYGPLWYAENIAGLIIIVSTGIVARTCTQSPVFQYSFMHHYIPRDSSLFLE